MSYISEFWTELWNFGRNFGRNSTSVQNYKISDSGRLTVVRETGEAEYLQCCISRNFGRNFGILDGIPRPSKIPSKITKFLTVVDSQWSERQEKQSIFNVVYLGILDGTLEFWTEFHVRPKFHPKLQNF